MKTYQPKTQESEYHTILGKTDFNIPMFGYRSAMIIFGFTLCIVLLTIGICQTIGIDQKFPLLLTTSLAFASSIGYSQYFFERKKGFTKGFWITVSLVFGFCIVLLYLVLYQGVMI